MINKQTQRFMWWTGLFVTLNIVGNLFGSRFIDIPFTTVVNPLGVVFAALIYELVPLANQKIGNSATEVATKVSFLFTVVYVVLIRLAMIVPYSVTDPTYANSYMAVFGNNIYILVGSLTAYRVSLFIQIRVLRKHANKSFLVNMLIQVVDTGVFALIAYGVGFRYLATADGRLYLLSFVCVQYVFKLILIFAIHWILVGGSKLLKNLHK